MIDGLCSRFLRGRGAGPPAFGEHEQASTRVSWVGLAYDVTALHQMFNELTGSLLGGPQLLSHVCGGGVALADADEREAVCRSDVGVATTVKAVLDTFHELAGKPQHRSGCLPALGAHDDHVDTQLTRADHTRQVTCLIEESTVPVYRSAEGVTFETHGSRFQSYAAPSRDSTQLCAWRLEVPANLQGVAHRPTHEEVILVLEGELQLTLDGVRSELCPGDVAFVPLGTEVRVDAGPEGAAAWVTTTPGLEAVMADGSRIAPPWAL